MARLRTVLVVVDPAIRDVVSADERARLEHAIGDAIAILLTGDRNLDGVRDFVNDHELRIAVLSGAGEVFLDAAPLPAALPDGATPLVGPLAEVWPGVDETWDAWLLETARMRVASVLDAELPERVTPFEAVTSLADAFPEALEPDWAPHVLVITARDAPVDVELADRLAYPLSTALSVTHVGAVPRPVEPFTGDFAPLLAPQTFDEGDVRCDDDRAIGRYPRAILGRLARSAMSGNGADVVSLCEARASAMIDVALPRRADSSDLPQVCLPRPLSLRDDGTPECVMRATLPALGRLVRCEQLGLASLGGVIDARGRVRSRCELPAVPPRAAETGAGFFYDDSSEAADACTGPQRLLVSPALVLPGGTAIEVTCTEGSSACGLEIASERFEPRDAGRD